MNKSILVLSLSFLLILVGCKDGTPPKIVSFKINDLEVNQTIPVYSANFNQTLDIEVQMSDNDDLLQFIAYVDTTGIGGTERLFAKGLSGTSGFAQWDLTMKKVDSLSQRYYNGQPLPIYFEISDAQVNTTSLAISFQAE